MLAEYANPPLWKWNIDADVAIAALEVAVDDGPARSLHPGARSFRPRRALDPGRHRLTVRATTAGSSPATIIGSAVAQVAELPGQAPLPDDPCYPAGAGHGPCGGMGVDGGQWPLRQIRLPELWQAFDQGVLREPEPVVVAVLDTGYTRHRDLAANLHPHAGYDFVRGRVAAGDGDGIDPDATDPGGDGSWHGTAIAGVIAAVADNGIGVAGIGWPWGRSRVAIMPVRVAGEYGATSYDVAQGLRYAAGLDNDSGLVPPTPARIINLSLAGPGPPDEVLEEALREVSAAGAVVVAAAGNHRSGVAAPANSAQTVAVGAILADGTLSPTSNTGPEIDLVAPGGDDARAVPTLAVGHGAGPSRWVVRPDHGTSIAAAHVSGVLALLAGFDRSLTLSAARTLLADTAVDLGPPGKDDRFGAGLLDAFALFGAYPARTDRGVAPAGRIAATAAPGGAGAGGVAPRTLIVRYRDREMGPRVSAAAGELLRARHAVAGVEAGAAGYALVQLNADQNREQVKARLAADPAVAAVFDNRIYLPATAPP